MLSLSQEKLGLLFRKIHGKELLAILFILLGIYFFRQDRHELNSLLPLLGKARASWITIGLLITCIYIILQAGLLVYSFRSVHALLRWPAALLLFLKQNFLSVFIPGGSVATFAYLPALLRRENIERHKIFQAAAIHSITGILTVIIVGLPVILYAAVSHHSMKSALLPLLIIGLLLLLLGRLVVSIHKKGRLYRSLTRYVPASGKYVVKFLSLDPSRPAIVTGILLSTGIELTGVLHVYIAMLACGAPISLQAAFAGYIVSTLFLIISPFLKGLGAVELSLVYVLKLYGYDTVSALEITLLYRVFEFWIPLAAGLVGWAWKGRNLFLRLLPPALIFLLGAVNIFSVLTPPIAFRLGLLQSYLPITLLHASNAVVILLGLILIMSAGFLLRGLKGAWWLALVLSILSLAGHLTKALDYEEAIIAFCVILVLVFTKKQYRRRSRPFFFHIGLITPVAAFITVLVFGAIGYYFLNKRHFGIDFSWQQSLRYAFTNFLLIGKTGLHPVTHFGREFVLSLKLLGLGAWVFLFYVLLRPRIGRTANTGNAREEAGFLVSKYGSSPVDHFKLSRDKLLFVPGHPEGFISYKIANGFAIVLEEPVCAEDDKISLLGDFESVCRRMGLKPAFYRVDEQSLYYFAGLAKKKLLIGQEGIMDVDHFSLLGRQGKSLRNTLNSLSRKGYNTRVHAAPLDDSLVNALKNVSDQWLSVFRKTEVVFSQGMFDAETISGQDVIAIHEEAGGIVAFLNIIPDYTPDECTYDLIRKTAGAPAGCMDALVIGLASYARERDIGFVNLGLVPMSGIGDPETAAERLVKYAYEKISRFRHYQGLREFKEKYAHQWINKYLLYENDFDLVQLPSALHKVMQPGRPKHLK